MNNFFKKISLVVLVFFVSNKAMAQNENRLPLIPLPQNIIVGKGYFEINGLTALIGENNDVISDLGYFQNYIGNKYNLHLKLTTGSLKKKVIFVKRNLSLKEDAYNLTVDSTSIEIEGGSGAGVFYGLQTLIQLLPPANLPTLSVNFVAIKDEPRFSWRGMHLDVSRHFFTVDEIKKYLDYISMYKMNVFHWHLTDDQGWRIEIKKYPRLASVAAFRKGTLIGHFGEVPEKYDTIRYGGFYTQEQIKEVINYASVRHITIVPEIEMPGHAQAALAAYPMLACTPGPFEVAKTWGVFNDVYCPREETFNFLEDVLTEVCDLFPGKYIHIGGDECPKDRWKESDYCQSLMKKLNLKNEHELQSYFVQRIGKFLQTKNKKMIGWDEILEGGVAEDATIMSWRGYAGGIEAAKQHHDVVMTPTSYCYFDYYQSKNSSEPLAIGGYLPLDMVYRFEPIADVMSKDDEKYVLGTQGNIWTEYMSDWKKVEYMAMPRMAALAEVAWLSKEKKDYNSFVTRLVSHTKTLNFLGVNYSKAFCDISARVSPAGNQGLNIELNTMYPNGQIRYATSGRNPDGKSPLYTGKIVVDQSVQIKAAIFEGPNMKGNVSEHIFSVNYATGKEITLVNQPDAEYSKGGAFSLVDGLKGNFSLDGNDWLGFTGKGFEATIDLGFSRTVTQLSLDVLTDTSSWVYPPRMVNVLVSNDNITFKNVGVLNADQIKTAGRKITVSLGMTNARFVKIIAPTIGKIPTPQPGAGNESWLMIDEIEVI